MAVREKTAAEMAAMQYVLAAAQAMLVIEAGRREQAAGGKAPCGVPAASRRGRRPGSRATSPRPLSRGGGGAVRGART